VYVPHLNPGARHTRAAIRAYVDQLRGLPDEYHPFVASVHMHDIRSGLAELLIELDVPVVTAGNTLRSDFFYRWIEIAQYFRYATSSQPGSELCHFHQLGGNYFVFGDRLAHDGSIQSDIQKRKRLSQLENSVGSVVTDVRNGLFRFPPSDEHRPGQQLFLTLYWNSGSRLSTKDLRKIWIRDLPSLGPSYWISWSLTLVVNLLMPRSSRRRMKSVFRRRSRG